VADDVAEGWVSGQRAHSVYGVVLDDTGRIDESATRARRAVMRGEATRGGHVP
jgi:N-methylhydantoinase B